MAYKAISKSEAKRFIHEVRKAHDVIIDRTYARKDTVTAAANGLTPQLPSIDAATKYLDGNGQWTTPYTLPTMSPTVKGGAKNGTGLVMADDTVNVDLRTAVTVSATDAEPRVYVIRSIDDLIAEYPDLTENDLGELSGVENHKYFLIDDIYFVADANTPSGGLFHPGEWYVPVRGQENFTVQSSAGYFDYEQGKFVVDDSTKKDLVAGQDYFIGLDDAEEQPILTFYHEGTHYPDVYGNATIWADGHNAVEGAKSIGNIVLGNNLSLTGDTLNASGSTYELPTMSPTVKGGAKNGSGLVMTGDNEEVVEVDLRTAVTNDENIIEVINPQDETGEIPYLVRNFYSNITESEGTDLLSVYLILDKGFDINKAKFYAEDQTELIRGEHFEFFPESEYSNPYISFYKKGMDILNNQSLLIKMINEQQQIAKIQIKDGLELNNNNNLSVNLAKAITTINDNQLLTVEILKEYQYTKYGANKTIQGINLDLNQDKLFLYYESNPTDPETDGYYKLYIIILTNDLNNCRFYFDENEEFPCDISWKEYQLGEEEFKINIPKTELIPYIGTFSDNVAMSKDYVLSEDFQEYPPCIYAYISKDYPSVANLKIKEGLTLDTEGISVNVINNEDILHRSEDIEIKIPIIHKFLDYKEGYFDPYSHTKYPQSFLEQENLAYTKSQFASWSIDTKHLVKDRWTAVMQYSAYYEFTSVIVKLPKEIPNGFSVFYNDKKLSQIYRTFSEDDGDNVVYFLMEPIPDAKDYSDDYVTIKLPNFAPDQSIAGIALGNSGLKLNSDSKSLSLDLSDTITHSTETVPIYTRSNPFRIPTKWIHSNHSIKDDPIDVEEARDAWSPFSYTLSGDSITQIYATNVVYDDSNKIRTIIFYPSAKSIRYINELLSFYGGTDSGQILLYTLTDGEFKVLSSPEYQIEGHFDDLYMTITADLTWEHDFNDPNFQYYINIYPLGTDISKDTLTEQPIPEIAGIKIGDGLHLDGNMLKSSYKDIIKPPILTKNTSLESNYVIEDEVLRHGMNDQYAEFLGTLLEPKEGNKYLIGETNESADVFEDDILTFYGGKWRYLKTSGRRPKSIYFGGFIHSEYDFESIYQSGTHSSDSSFCYGVGGLYQVQTDTPIRDYINGDIIFKYGPTAAEWLKISSQYFPGNGLMADIDDPQVINVDFTDTSKYSINNIRACNSSFIISNPDSSVRDGDQGLRLLSFGRKNVINSSYIDIQAGDKFSGIRIGSPSPMIQDYYFEEESGSDDYYYYSGNDDYYYYSGSDDYYY